MNRLNVRTPAQREIFVHELQGQLSDGHWENEKTDRRLWDCEVEVDPNNLGCNFKPRYPVDFSDSDLTEWLGERMVGYAQRVDPSYGIEDLPTDLEELTEIVFGNPKKKSATKTPPPCPECEKLAAVSVDSNKIGDFLEWLDTLGADIGIWIDEEFVPYRRSTNDLLAEYYGIDLNKVEKERRALLGWLREVQGGNE